MLNKQFVATTSWSMTSIEKRRTRAYDDDLRWRMVWQSEVCGLLHEEIAKNLLVDRSTVSRTVGLFNATGSVSKKIYPSKKAYRKLTDPAQFLILNLVLSKPGILLKEIQCELLLQLMVEVEISTICRFLHSSGFSHQKLRQVAIQRDYYFRQLYLTDISTYNPDMLIYLDETGADYRNAVRRYGYSLRGIPLEQESFLVRGERLSAIAFMSIRGIIDVFTTNGTTNGDIFYEFVLNYLIPHLQPFNGINPCSVVVMDNCVIHHVPRVMEVIEETGALLHFLPPYSPDLNPIELVFSKVKNEIRNLERSMITSDIKTLMLAGFASITEQDCQGWFSHCQLLK